MTITIPPAALTALRDKLRELGWYVDDADVLAAALALLEAWPGMLTRPVLPGFADIILPLNTQENENG